MKCEIVLPDHPNAWIHFSPENQKEANQLLLLARNAKSDGATIGASFSGDSVRGEIHFHLRRERNTSISNFDFKKR